MLKAKDDFNKDLAEAVERVIMLHASQCNLPKNFGRVTLKEVKKTILRSAKTFYGSNSAASRATGLSRGLYLDKMN